MKKFSRKKRWSEKDYKNSLKIMRGKITFDYDLRKKLRPAQKGHIRRAANEFRAALQKNTRFVKVRRNPGEPLPSFRRRLAKIKDKTGMGTRNSFAGIVTELPPDVKVTVKGTDVIARKGRYREKFFFVNPLELVKDARAVITKIVRQMRREKFNFIAPLAGPNRIQSFDIKTEGGERAIDNVVEVIERWISKYKKVVDFTGAFVAIFVP